MGSKTRGSARAAARLRWTKVAAVADTPESLKSFKKKDASKDDEPPPDDPENPSTDFHGEKRSNETHASTTDPDAKLAKKSKGTTAKMSYSAHALIENRHGLLVAFQMDEANDETRGVARPRTRSLDAKRRVMR